MQKLQNETYNKKSLQASKNIERKNGCFYVQMWYNLKWRIYIKDSADTKWTSGFHLKFPFHFSQ